MNRHRAIALLCATWFLIAGCERSFKIVVRVDNQNPKSELFVRAVQSELNNIFEIAGVERSQIEEIVSFDVERGDVPFRHARGLPFLNTYGIRFELFYPYLTWWPSNALAFVMASPCGPGLYGAIDATLNLFFDAGGPSRHEFSAPTILKHELGHIFGLEHSGDTLSPMYPTLSPGVVKAWTRGDTLRIKEMLSRRGLSVYTAACQLLRMPGTQFRSAASIATEWTISHYRYVTLVATCIRKMQSLIRHLWSHPALGKT